MFSFLLHVERTILIFLWILYSGYAAPTQCPEGQIQCHNDSRCCPVVAEPDCNPRDCGENMECNTLNKCVCKFGFIEYLDFDTKVKNRCAFPLPEECANEADCGPNSICSAAHKCQCNEGFYKQYIEKNTFSYCEKTESKEVKLPEDFGCPKDYAECSSNLCCGPTALCIGAECVCKKGFLPKIGNGKTIDCVGEENPAELAKCPAECGPNSQCLSGKCVCEKGFHETINGYSNSLECTADKKDVAKPSLVVDPIDKEPFCETGYERCSEKCCGPNSQCVENKCSCSQGFQEIPNDTSNIVNCEAKESATLSKVFKCDLGYETCLQKCCGPNSHCLSEKCTCNQGFVEKQNLSGESFECQALDEAKPPISECAAGYEKCFQFCCGPNSRCLDKKCKCYKGFQELFNNTTNSTECEAIPVLDSTEILSCSADYEKCSNKCCGPLSQCIDGECVCSTGFRPKLAPESSLNIECEGVEEDPPQPFEEGLHFVEISPCESGFAKCSKMCCGPNSQCVEETCKCDIGFFGELNVTTKTMQCQPSESDSPDVDAICKADCGPNSQCRLGKCECNAGFTATLNQITQIMECLAPEMEEINSEFLPCDPQYEQCLHLCCGSYSQCLDGKCVCREHFRLKLNESSRNVNCEPIVEEPPKCPADHENCSDMCCGPNSQCLNLKCHCANGFEPVPNESKHIISCKLVPALDIKKDATFLDLYNFDDIPPPKDATFLDLYNFDDIPPPNDDVSHQAPHSSPNRASSAVGDLYDFEDFCLLYDNQCSDLCCGLNADCNQDGECVCPPDFIETYSAIMKTLSCVEPPLQSSFRMTYMAIGATCVLLSMLFLCIKCCKFMQAAR